MNGTTILSATLLGNLPLSWSIAQTGDFNGDGNTDILWEDNSGNVAAWLMNGADILSVANYGNVAAGGWAVQAINSD